MKYALIAFAVVAVLVAGFMVVKKVSPVSWGWWGTTNTSSGVALNGHDPVAYFEQGAAVPGNSELSFDWGDASWYFATAANRDQFVANPERFAPQFGSEAPLRCPSCSRIFAWRSRVNAYLE